MGLDRKDIDPDPAYLSTAQVGALLGTSPDFVVGEIRDGRLAALVLERPGMRTLYRVTEQQLADYMKKYRWSPPAA